MPAQPEAPLAAGFLEHRPGYREHLGQHVLPLVGLRQIGSRAVIIVIVAKLAALLDSARRI